MGKPHDMRLNDSWGLWCRQLFDEHPERSSATEGESAFAAFCAGWRYRFEAAMNEFGGDGRDRAETKLIRDQMALFQREYEKAFGMLFGSYESERRIKRLLDSQAEQIRALRGDPIDAPMFRRISKQRQEIKRLTKEVTELRGALALANETNQENI